MNASPLRSFEAPLKRRPHHLIRRFYSNTHFGFKCGAVIVTLLVLIAILAPWIAPYSPLEDFTGLSNLPPQLSEQSGHRFLLGTDPLGRDLLSRLIYGTRYCLLMGCASVFLSAAIGIPLGMLAGYHRSADRFISKSSDIIMSFPAILIAIIIVAILGPGLVNAVIAVGLTNVPSFVRLTRSQVLSERSRDYVQAAIALGLSDARILLAHISPNIFSSLMVLASLSLGSAILESAALSFLNLGVTPPAPEWGSMIRSGMETFLSINPWVSLFSGCCIFLNVLGFNLLGDALRDRFDPLLRSRS